MNNTAVSNKSMRECDMRKTISIGLKSEKLRSIVLWELGEKYKLTQNEVEVLIFLYNNPELNTSKDIVKYRWTSKSLVCKSVRSLLDNEYLDPAADYDDGRVMRLIMPEKTREIAKDLAEKEKEFYDLVFAGITDKEMAAIRGFAERLDVNLNEFLKKTKKK